MTKFLVNYMGSEAGTFQIEMTDADNQAFMQAWGDWAEQHKDQILDGGAPVGKTKRVTADGISDAKNAITGYTIVEADTHQAAANMFTTHPHVAMLKHPIEVMECPPIPDM